jgi:CxxC-x17-CxxC domain-containing protein
MIITKIQLSAMERVRIPENDRKDFYMYVDEFQNFATDSFKNILSEARKYRLNLVMAHQYVGQLVTDTSTAVRDAVFGNVGTMLSFRVGAEDAEFLEKEFTPEFLQDDLVRLANRDIYIKLMIDGITSRPFSARTITIPAIAKDDKKRNEIIRLSRGKYARDRQAVEDDINRWAANADLARNQSQPRGRTQQDGTTLYDAVCSNCDKKTKVVFEPTSGKPVYCKNCFKKMKDSRPAKPAQSASMPAESETPEDNGALADLGIEFGSSAKAKIENISFNPHKKDKNVQNQSVQNSSRGKKREINLVELRKALEESLENKETEDNPDNELKERIEQEKMDDEDQKHET